VRSPSVSSCRPRRETTATWPPASIDWPGCRLEGDILIRRLLFVAFFLEVGLLLIVLPWSTFWERNYFVYAWPALRPVVTNDYVRGAISGLGLVNLVTAFFELVPVFRARETAGGPDAGGYRAADTQVDP
jgi:hypothetical protein